MQQNWSAEIGRIKSKLVVFIIQAVKKIDETRKRATDIVGQRRRNMD